MGFSGPQGSGGGTIGGGDVTDGGAIAVPYIGINYASGDGTLGAGHLPGIDAALAAASGTPNLAAVLAMGYIPAAPAQEFGDPTHDFAFHGRSMTVPAAVDFTFALGAGKALKTTVAGVASLDILPAGVLKLYASASAGAQLRGHTSGFVEAKSFNGSVYTPVYADAFYDASLGQFYFSGSQLQLSSTLAIAWASTATWSTTKDLFTYRSAAGVLGIGTTAANGLGTLACAGITSTGNLTLALGAASAVKVGIAGAGGSLVPLAGGMSIGDYTGIVGINLNAGPGPYIWLAKDGNGRVVFGTGADAEFGRLAAASIRQGAVPSASPVAQTFTLGESSRPGTDTNVAGASGTLRPGLGTGTGTEPVIGFDMAVLTGSGSGVQSYVRSLDVRRTGVLKLYASASTGVNIVAGSGYVNITSFNDATYGGINAGTGYFGGANPVSEPVTAFTTAGGAYGSAVCVAYSATTNAIAAKDLSEYRVAAGVLGIGTGSASGAGSAWLAGTAGEKRLATAPTDSTATLTNLTALTETLIAGRIYTGTMQIVVNNALAADGLQIDFSGGTVTMTSVQFGFSSALGATLGTRTSTALATPITLSALADTSDVVIDVFFTCVVNAGGTLIPRFAKAGNIGGATLTVRVGGYLHLKDTIG